MKFKLRGMVFSLLFALGLVFSFSFEAGASHGGDVPDMAAKDVNPANESQMRAFLAHLTDYSNQLYRESLDKDANTQIRVLTILARELRRPGPYNHGDVYTVSINSRTQLILNHARHPELLAYKFNPDTGDSNVAGVLKSLIENASLDEIVCENYQYGGQERVACAIKGDSSVVGQATTIAGIHHTADDAPFEAPDCAGLGFTLETTAKHVYDDPTEDNLKAYVKDIIRVTKKEMQDLLTAIINEDPGILQKLLAALTGDGNVSSNSEVRALIATLVERFSARTPCYGLGDFKHGNIYPFIMSPDLAGTVLLNGNNFDLNGLDLEADDNELPGDDQSITGLFRRGLTKGENREPRGGDYATVEYRWDDPEDPDDTIEGWFEMGSVPGSSPKTSYIEVVNLVEGYTLGGFSAPANFENLLIFGSGIYPEESTAPESTPGEDDDGACTIAGTGHTSQGTLLNLFLIASVLFSVVFPVKRA